MPVRCWTENGVDCHLPECQGGNYCWELEAMKEISPLVQAIELLQMCRSCDLIYGAHDHGGIGIGQKLAGVVVKDDTTIADVVDAFLAKHKPGG
jgi:hypothetical protein